MIIVRPSLSYSHKLNPDFVKLANKKDLNKI